MTALPTLLSRIPPCITDKLGTRNPEMQRWYRQKKKELPFGPAAQDI